MDSGEVEISGWTGEQFFSQQPANSGWMESSRLGDRMDTKAWPGPGRGMSRAPAGIGGCRNRSARPQGTVAAGRAPMLPRAPCAKLQPIEI